MSTVIEEKLPMIHDYLIERYGQLSQSAVDAVSQGLKAAISMGVASSTQDKIENFGIQSLGGPDTAQSILGPLIGTKISEAAGVASPEQQFQSQLKGLEKANQAELTTFAKTVFGQEGFVKSLQERGIIINGVPIQSAQEKGIWVQAENQAKHQAEKGIVGPEYKTLKEMEDTLMKTLRLQQDLQQFNMPVRA
jgi:hypothetical protein